MCHLHTHLAQWEQAIEWCSKSIAGDPTDFYPLVDLAAANAWPGHDKEAKEAAAQLQKVYPGFTVQTWAGIHWTDDPTFNAQYQRIVDGLRKAGCRRGRRRRIEAPAGTGAMLVACRLAGLSALERRLDAARNSDRRQLSTTSSCGEGRKWAPHVTTASP